MLIIIGISMIRLIENDNVHHKHNVIKIFNIITVIIQIRSQWKINKTNAYGQHQQQQQIYQQRNS